MILEDSKMKNKNRSYSIQPNKIKEIKSAKKLWILLKDLIN